MGRQEKDLSECMFCMRKMKRNIQPLTSVKCKGSCIEQKLMSFISPSDYKSLSDTSLFPDANICKSCFNLVNTIDRDTLKIETLIGQSVNFQLNSDAAINGKPEEQWPEHMKEYTPKQDTPIGKRNSKDQNQSRPKTMKKTGKPPESTPQLKVKSLPPRKVKSQNPILIQQKINDDESGAEGLDLDDSVDDEDYVPIDVVNKAPNPRSPAPLRASSRIKDLARNTSKTAKLKILKQRRLRKAQTHSVDEDVQSKEGESETIFEVQNIGNAEEIESMDKEPDELQEEKKNKRINQNKTTQKILKVSKDPKVLTRSKPKQSGRRTKASQSAEPFSLPLGSSLQDSRSRSQKTSKALSKASEYNENQLTSNNERCSESSTYINQLYEPFFENQNNEGLESSVASEKFKCDTCNKTFITKNSLTAHAVTHSGKRPYKCEFPECNKSYAYETSLMEHKLGHENKLPHKCPYPECGKAFVRSRDLKTHITLHTGEKPFKCEFPGCDKAYRLRNQYYIHRRMHTGERPYKCEYEGCDRAFIRRKSLKLHEASHSSEQPFCCDECGKRFTHIRYFKLHKISHQKRIERLTQPPPEKTIPCETCGKMFSTKLNVRRHINLVHKGVKPKRRMDRVFLCEINGCNRSFRWKSCMVRHQALKHRREDYKHRGKLVKYICPVETCREEFNRRNLLREHSTVVHGKIAEHGDPKTFKEWLCFECGMAVTKKQMSRHQDTYHSSGSLFNTQEHGEYSCMTEQCGRKFKTAEELKAHIPSHTGNAPYKCSKDGCKKTFLLKKNLDLHMMVHNNIKPHKCTYEECDKSFVTQLCLMRHSKVHFDGMYVCPVETCKTQFKNMNNAGGHLAGHRGEDPYICGLCGAVFTAYNPWARHKKRHASALGQKLHTCPECGKSFSLKSELTRHMPVHSEEKPYICEICGMGYASKTGYSCHKLTHGEKKYFCTFEGCGKGFTLPLTLKRHQAIHEKPSNLCCYCGKFVKNNLRKHKCGVWNAVRQEAIFPSQSESDKVQVTQEIAAVYPQFSQPQLYQDPASIHITPSVHQSQDSPLHIQQPHLLQSQIQHTHLQQPQLLQSQLQLPQPQHHQQQQQQQQLTPHFSSDAQLVQHGLQPQFLQPIMSHSDVNGPSAHLQLLNDVIPDGSMQTVALPPSMSLPSTNAMPPTSASLTSFSPFSSVSLATVAMNSMPQTSLPPMTLPFSPSAHHQYYEIANNANGRHGHSTPTSMNQ